jgi:hypothetical protein
MGSTHFNLYPRAEAQSRLSQGRLRSGIDRRDRPRLRSKFRISASASRAVSRADQSGLFRPHIRSLPPSMQRSLREQDSTRRAACVRPVASVGMRRHPCAGAGGTFYKSVPLPGVPTDVTVSHDGKWLAVIYSTAVGGFFAVYSIGSGARPSTIDVMRVFRRHLPTVPGPLGSRLARLAASLDPSTPAGRAAPTRASTAGISSGVAPCWPFQDGWRPRDCQSRLQSRAR